MKQVSMIESVNTEDGLKKLNGKLEELDSLEYTINKIKYIKDDDYHKLNAFIEYTVYGRK